MKGAHAQSSNNRPERSEGTHPSHVSNPRRARSARRGEGRRIRPVKPDLATRHRRKSWARVRCGYVAPSHARVSSPSTRPEANTRADARGGAGGATNRKRPADAAGICSTNRRWSAWGPRMAGRRRAGPGREGLDGPPSAPRLSIACSSPRGARNPYQGRAPARCKETTTPPPKPGSTYALAASGHMLRVLCAVATIRGCSVRIRPEGAEQGHPGIAISLTHEPYAQRARCLDSARVAPTRSRSE